MRPTIRLLLTLGIATVTVTSAGAQQPRWIPELRPFVGTVVPTGGLRDDIGSETMYGAEVAAELQWWLHAVGTFTVAPARTRVLVADRGLRVYQYDAGAEVQARQDTDFGLTLHPFWGAGLGARTYSYASSELEDRTCLSGYLSTGMELRAAGTGVRIEGRDNVFCYRSPLPGSRSGTRNDVSLALGLVIHF